jgi:hypothetical protein
MFLVPGKYSRIVAGPKAELKTLSDSSIRTTLNCERESAGVGKMGALGAWESKCARRQAYQGTQTHQGDTQTLY